MIPMASPKKPRLRPLVQSVIDSQGQWAKPSVEVNTTDAQRILESLVAEYGVDATVAAMDRQGFKGQAYKTLIALLHREALARRAQRHATASAPLGEIPH